jgi:hypothetical protein
MLPNILGSRRYIVLLWISPRIFRYRGVKVGNTAYNSVLRQVLAGHSYFTHGSARNWNHGQWTGIRSQDVAGGSQVEYRWWTG